MKLAENKVKEIDKESHYSLKIHNFGYIKYLGSDFWSKNTHKKLAKISKNRHFCTIFLRPKNISKCVKKSLRIFYSFNLGRFSAIYS